MRDVSEKTQQSSDPSKISQQQRSDLGRLVLQFVNTPMQYARLQKRAVQDLSDLGRLVLQFVNTPMQYARLQKRAVQDLVNRRGDPKEHVSKLIYYGFVQNLIFNSLQQALFAFGFEDDEKKVEAALPKKTMDIANGMLDSSLRGLYC
jgi:predicted solute-binding protein